MFLHWFSLINPAILVSIQLINGSFMKIPRSVLSLAFWCAAPAIWNSIPVSVTLFNFIQTQPQNPASVRESNANKL